MLTVYQSLRSLNMVKEYYQGWEKDVMLSQDIMHFNADLGDKFTRYELPHAASTVITLHIREVVSSITLKHRLSL